MEAGTFKKFYWGDATDYVMLVNRRLNNDNGVLTDPDTVRMVMNSGRFFTRDVRTGMVSFGTWYENGDSTAFKDTLDAGWGELYHVKRCLQGVQDTSSRLHELEIVTGIWTIDSGVTVTATPGTTVIFQPGTKIVVRNGARLVVDTGANIDLRNGIIECEGSGSVASILVSDSIGLTGSGEIRGGRIEWANGWMVRRSDTLRFTGGAKLDFTCDTVVHLDTKALLYGTVLFKGSEHPYEFGACLDTIIVGAWDGLFASSMHADTGAFLLHLPYMHCVPNASISSNGTLDSGCKLHFRDTVQCLVTGHIDAEYTEFAKSELSPAGSVGWEGLIVAYGSSQVQLDECVIMDVHTSTSSNPGYALHLYHSPNQANSMKHTRIVRYLETVYDTAKGIAVFLQGDSATASYLNMECNEIGNAWASGVTTSRSTFDMLRNLVDGNHIGVEASSYSNGKFFENTVRNAKNADLYWPTGIGISLHASTGWLGDSQSGRGLLGKNKVTNNDYRQLQADFGAHLWAGAKNQSRAVAGRNQITSGNGALRLWVDSVGTVVEACSDWWGVLPDSIDQYGNCALTKAQKDTLVYCSIKSYLDLSSARCDTAGSNPGDCVIASRDLFSTPPFAKQGTVVANIPAQSVFDLPDIAAAGNFSEIYRFVSAAFSNPALEQNRVLSVLSTVLQLERAQLAEYPDSAGRIAGRFTDFCNTQYGRASNTTIRAGLLYYLGALHSLTGDLSSADAAIGELHNIAPASAYAKNAHMLSFGNALSRNDTLTANIILSLMRTNGPSISELRIAEAMKYGYLRVPRRNSIPSLRKRAWVSNESTTNMNRIPSRIEVHASPDPFGVHVSFHYRLEEETVVRFVLYSALGEEIAVLHDGMQSAGEHHVRFTAAPALPNGVYYYVINTGYGSASGKVRLVR
ncbi:MAG: hypothetical protein IPP94_14970 [Ignavibacteria bacterium]|nr:hypothetical protein [Ignavibacteria bacterium]